MWPSSTLELKGEGFIFSLFSSSHLRRSWLYGTLALVDVYYTQYVSHTHTHPALIPWWVSFRCFCSCLGSAATDVSFCERSHDLSDCDLISVLIRCRLWLFILKWCATFNQWNNTKQRWVGVVAWRCTHSPNPSGLLHTSSAAWKNPLLTRF